MKFFILLFVSFTVWASDSPKINQTFLNLIESRSLPEETENGPNCVNTALKLLNYPLDYEYSPTGMMLPVIESSYCKIVLDTPKIGDLILVLGHNDNQQLTIDHAAVMTETNIVTEKQSANGLFRQYKWHKNYFWDISFDDRCTMADFRDERLFKQCRGSGFVSVLRCEHNYFRDCDVSDIEKLNRIQKILSSLYPQLLFDLDHLYGYDKKITQDNLVLVSNAQKMVFTLRELLKQFSSKNSCLALEMQGKAIEETLETEIWNVTSAGIFSLN